MSCESCQTVRKNVTVTAKSIIIRRSGENNNIIRIFFSYFSVGRYGEIQKKFQNESECFIRIFSVEADYFYFSKNSADNAILFWKNQCLL